LVNYPPELSVRIAECYLHSKRYLEGLYWCNTFGDEDKEELTLVQVKLHMKLGQYDKGLDLLSKKTFADQKLNNQAIFLSGCSNAYLWRLDEAMADWNEIPSISSLAKTVQEYKSITNEAKQYKFLSPAKSAMLAAIPGLGYLYSGHTQTAISALIVICGTAWGSVAAFKRKSDGTGYVVGLMALGWYSGSIYGSFLSAKRYNKHIRNQYLKHIRF